MREVHRGSNQSVLYHRRFWHKFYVVVSILLTVPPLHEPNINLSSQILQRQLRETLTYLTCLSEGVFL